MFNLYNLTFRVDLCYALKDTRRQGRTSKNTYVFWPEKK